jgi:ABC-type antimicrobial peptide transport system permease subunit
MDQVPVSSVLGSAGFMMAMILVLGLFSYIKFKKMNITE